MPRSVVLATALVSLALPALARGELSERQKRKALLPALHATTECIAQEILRSPTALSHARQNKWSEAVQSMPEVCKAFGSTLIAEHDRLYGPGTGKAFVEGPYASDLPRALKARIRPALKRQAAQFTMVAEAPNPLQRRRYDTASHAALAAGAKQPRRRGRLCASGPEADRDH